MAITAAQLNVLFTSQGADRVKGDLKGLGDAVDTVGKAYAAIGAAGVGGLGLMVNASMQLESAMANVQSIAGLTESGLASLTDQVQSLSAEMGKAPTEMANALYEINSSGFEAADAMLILEKSSVAAGAGLTTVDVAATATTAVLNAFGQGAEDAGNVTDVLFKTVDSGVITFEALAKNLGQVLPIASALGVEIEELGAAYAQMTLQGISAAQSETAIAAVMRSALNETESMTRAVEDYGYASAEALIQTEGLAGYLEFLAQASGGSSAALTELLGTADATVGALALMKNEGADFNAMLGEMQAAASDGAYTLGVFETQTDTTAYAIDQMVATLQNAAIGMGDALSPAVRMAAESITAIGDQFNRLPEAGQSAIATFAAVASGSALLLGSITLAVPKIIEFRQAVQSLRAAGGIFGTLAGRAGPLSLGLGAVAAAGVLMYDSMQQGAEAARSLDAELTTLSETIERLRLSGDTTISGLAETILTEVENIEFATSGLEGSYEMLMRLFDFPEGTQVQTILSSAVKADLDRVKALSDDFIAYINESLGKLNPEQQEVFLTYISDMLDSAETTLEGSNLDDLIEETMAKPLNEIPGIVANAEVALGSLDDQMARGNMSFALYQERSTAAAESNENLAGSFEEVEKGADGASGAIERIAEAQEKWIAFNEYATNAILNLTNSLDYLSQVNIAGLGTGATEAADAFTDVAAAMDSVLSIFGQIDAMESRIGKAGAIADYLFGPDGNPWDSIGPMRDVFDAGLISWEQFTQAIQDGIAIQEAAASSQVYLDKMRVDQLPILRETTEAYQEQIIAISELGAAEQMVALGWMDAGMQDRVQQFAELGNQLRTLGPAGEVAMQQVVDGIVATDPVLTQMLDNLGLIEQQANGDYTINMDATGAMSEIGRLTEAIVGLVDYLDDGLLNQSFTLDIEADVTQAEATVRNWAQDGYTGGWGAPVMEVPVDPVVPDGWWETSLANPAYAPTVEVEPTIGAWPEFDIPQPEPIIFPAEVETGAATTSLNAFEEEASAPIVKTVTVDISGWGTAAGETAVGAAQSVLDALDGETLGIPESVTVTVNLQDNATAGLLEIGSTVGGLDMASATPVIYANTDDAMGKMLNVNTAIFAVDMMTATVDIFGDNSDAMSAIGEVQAYDGSVLATAYVNIVAQQIGSGSAIANNIVAGARSALGIRSPSKEFEEIGKYTAMGFNQGFEREFSAMDFGYNVASPAYAGYGANLGASSGSGGSTYAPVINNYITPGPGMNEDDLAEAVMRKMAPALEVAERRHARAMGGV